MKNLNLLIVEGNLREENQGFIDGGIKTHTESLKDSISHFTKNLDIDVANPSSDENIFENVKDLNKYDALIWGGSSLNIYNDTIEIRRQFLVNDDISDFRNNSSSLFITPSHDTTLATRYQYNSFNNIVSKFSPDDSLTLYWYDKVGRTVLSQNEKQRKHGEFNYIF